MIPTENEVNNKEMIEGLQMEYSAIRDEIILLMNEHNTHITNLFLIGITILGFGYQLNNPTFFLILYLIVVPFQTLINNKQYMMIRCGVYIKKYIEPKIKGLNWEQEVHDIDSAFKEQYKKKILGINIEDELCDFGAFILSVIALISYTYDWVRINDNAIWIQAGYILGECIAVISTVIAFVLCNKGKKFDKIYKEYNDIIKRRQR